MTKYTIEELQLENQALRELVISLSATLLRKIALDPPRFRRNASSKDAEQILQEAERCFSCARVPGLNKQIAEGLETAGNELMARAVVLESVIQREKWKK